MSQPQLVRTGNPLERRITYAEVDDIDQDEAYSVVSIEESVEYSEISSSDVDDMDVSERPDSNQICTIRVQTAPARPLTDVEEFRQSADFILIERTLTYSQYLILRSDQKYDLDSDQGQRACKNFLGQIEHLWEVFKVQTNSRIYRIDFSKAYRVLYRENSLCYLTEILDSAQEGFPYLWVNGEKYVFSREVMDSGQRLFIHFWKFNNFLRDIYNRLHDVSYQETIDEIIDELVAFLEEFDSRWVSFEQYYVMELMLIEADARRFITEAIEYEREMVFLEIKQKAKGKLVLDCMKYNWTRRKFVEMLGRLNSVSNLEGKGRDDLTIDIMLMAEGLIRITPNGSSRSIRALFNNIRKSFGDLRKLLRRYEQNIEIVDPQLKNNPELVDCLMAFEASWEKGKTYILNQRRCDQLVFASQLFEQLGEAFPELQQQIECRDAELFTSIPGLLIIQCLEGDDWNICQYFYPVMFDENTLYGMMFKRLKRAHQLGKLAAWSEEDYVHWLQLELIGEGIPFTARRTAINKKFDNIDFVVHKIRILAMELGRHKPTDWNCFMDVILA